MEKRLFVSIPLPKVYQDLLAACQERDRYRGLRYVAQDQFHMTVCFLGDVNEQLLPVIADALAPVAQGRANFPLEFERIGLFPTKVRLPNMIWAFFKENEAFEVLVRDVKTALIKADPFFLPLREEWRKDIPHVTLARFRGGDYPRQAQQPSQAMPSLQVDRLELMDSVLYPDGPFYKSLAEFPFNH